MSETVTKEKDPATFNLAVASVVCGVIGYFFILPSIPGLIFGFMALHKIKKSHGLFKGRTLAIVGIFISGASAVLWFVLFPLVCFFWGFAP